MRMDKDEWKYGCMEGWVEVRMDRRMSGGVGGWKDEWKCGRMEG